jgi:CBS domain-containing protein
MHDNPFPAVMGRVCYRPCGTACNRAQVDTSVSINLVARFLGDEAIKHGGPVFANRAPVDAAPTGKRVLVAGAGPSGLSAAYHLTRLGHQVTIRGCGHRTRRHEHIGRRTYIPAGDRARILDAVPVLRDMEGSTPPMTSSATRTRCSATPSRPVAQGRAEPLRERPAMNKLVKDVMTSHVVYAKRDATFKAHAARMRELHVSGLPVVDDVGKVIDIHEEITGTILGEFLMDPRRFSVTVNDGIVTLQGEPETADLGHQIVRTIRHIQGVVAVRDRLTYPEPDMAAAPGFYVNHYR